MRRGEHDRAIEKQEASLKLQREIDNEEGQAISLHQLSILYRLKEDHDTALAYSREAETLARKIGRGAGIAKTLHEQGIILNRLNRLQEAVERFGESLKIARRIGDEASAADSLAVLGQLYMGAEMMREAIAASNEALEIYQRQGNPKVGIVLGQLGSIHFLQGEYSAALEKYQQALSIFQKVGMANDARIAQEHIARVRGKMGK